MPDEPLDLEEAESTEAYEFPPAERKITTQPYDLSVQTLLTQWQSNELIIPDIQREYIWDNGRASRLVESLLLNIPVPPVYFAETEDARFEIIDGHQRVRSVVRFIDNQFALTGLRVLDEYTGKRFHKLPKREQRYLKSRTFRAVVIGRDSHPDMRFEVFERLNTGGIALNAQELRNSIYRGVLNNALKEAVLNPDFRSCIDTKRPRRRMVDQELVLRFLAFRDELAKYRPPLKRFLNEYMRTFCDPPEQWLEERIGAFNLASRHLMHVLGNRAFRLIDAAGEPVTDETGRPLPRGVNRALFDAQSLAFSWIVNDTVDNREQVIREVARTLSAPNFLDAVRQATGDRARVHLRVSLMVEALNRAGLELQVPLDFDA